MTTLEGSPISDIAPNLDPPGKPGIEPHWTSSAKSGVGTSAGPRSRVWFTVSHGIVDEVYFPNFDMANTRDFGLLVSDGKDFFSEEKRDTDSETAMIAPGVPGFRLTNRSREGRYQIEKTVLTDPEYDVLLQRVRFTPLAGSLEDYSLFALLSPHIRNQGNNNDGWVGQYKGNPMLFANREGASMALACSAPWLKRSVGYVGVSDGWQDVSAHKRMEWEYVRAFEGNIALTAEIDLATANGEFVLALGFGDSPEDAALKAHASLLRPFAEVAAEYTQHWQALQLKLLDLDEVEAPNLYRVSTSVMATHGSKSLLGAMIASLSIPWGTTKSDDDMGGYHLIWPRDMVESAGAMLAAGNEAAAKESLVFLMATQEGDGHWPQNMWHSGVPYWNGIQIDETAFPVLLADALRRGEALDGLEVWPMIRKAAAFIVCHGPVTLQDRWEEDGGYSPFTLAVEIAALLAAADFADIAGEPAVATYLRETADSWNDRVEHWTYVRNSHLAQTVGVDGYYVRISPPDIDVTGSILTGFVPIKNRPPGESELPCEEVVSPDALALVRFGLRSADDPRIRNTVKVIDAVLRTETATGPAWHRYHGDGYGEKEDGTGFDGTGIGRGWPLLAGERAHYEIAAGNMDEARRLLHVIEAQTSPGGLIPEQIWDAPDIPALELFNGKPSGSAMPLVWAHAEYVKLLRSLRDGAVFDLPPQPVARYGGPQARPSRVSWRFNNKCDAVVAGQNLRIETIAPATLRWSTDGWLSSLDAKAVASGLGTFYVDLDVGALEVGALVSFTFFWPEHERWEGKDFEVQVYPPGQP